MQGPCTGAYHVPTDFEWVTAVNLITGKTSAWVDADVTNLQATLKLPMPGIRIYVDGSLSSQGSIAYYWSSSPLTSSSYYMFFQSNAVTLTNYYARAYGFSVRCLKN